MSSLSHQKRKIGIIGAGLGGLSAAVTLAHAGFQVTVFERNEGPGGKMGHFEQDGFSWDTGPSLLTMPQVLEDLFRSVGQKLEDYLTLVPLPLTCRYFWNDGTVIDEDQAFLKRPDVSRFLKYAEGLYEISADAFLFNDLSDIWRQFTPRNFAKLRHLPSLMDPRPMASTVKRYFRDPHLQQLFCRFATYNGSSPYRTPSAFNIIPYVQAKFGGWYVQGGMYNIALALYKLARRFSVEFRFGARVTGAREISTGHAIALDGVWERFDDVICNKDALAAFQSFVSREHAADFKKRYLKRRPPSLSGFIVFLGVGKKYEQLAHHNVFFSNDYPAEFAQMFHERTPASEPTLYICSSSRTDPTRAPEGCDNWFVLANAPAVGRTVDWSQVGPTYMEAIISRLVDLGFSDLRDHIRVKHWFGPNHFRSRYSAYAGSIYGFASHGLFSAFERPPIKWAGLRNFYFAGGSTHPGGGIPLVLTSGRLAARKIIAASGDPIV